MERRPLLSISPQSGVGGLTPSPRKLSGAGDDRVGDAERRQHDDRGEDVRQDVAEQDALLAQPPWRGPPRRTGSRTASAEPRTTRMNSGMPEIPTAIMALQRLGPSTAMMTSASRIPGNASITSTAASRPGRPSPGSSRRGAPDRPGHHRDRHRHEPHGTRDPRAVDDRGSGCPARTGRSRASTAGSAASASDRR